MAAKKSVERRPSTLLRHRHVAQCQHWKLVQSSQCAAAAAACESSGAGAPPGGLLRTWTDGHAEGVNAQHVDSHYCEQRAKLKSSSRAHPRSGYAATAPRSGATPAYATADRRGRGEAVWVPYRQYSMPRTREDPCRTPWRVERGRHGGKFRRDARGNFDRLK
jgi:hypothetical protein